MLVLGAVAAGVLVYRCSSDPAPPQDASASASSSSDVPLAPPRCVRVDTGSGFVIGTRKGDARDGPAEPQAPEVETAQPDRDDLLAPFAVIVGRAGVTKSGYALGVLGDSEAGSEAFLVTMGADGQAGTSLKLLRSRPDLDPPVVAAREDSDDVYVATLEPNASSRAIRMARVRGGQIEWGAEIPEDNDGSLAIDMAITSRRGVVAWDTMDDDEKGYVHVASFALDSFGTITSTRVATTKALDADTPRVVATDKGFYLAYLVHGEQLNRERVAKSDEQGEPPRPTSASASPKSTKPKKKPQATDRAPGDVDESRGGESISISWIEVVPLDETGAQSGEPLRATPEGVTVQSFDMAASDGALIIAYRDDDSPTGGGGGLIRMVSLRPGGLGASYESPDPLPSDGIPTVLPGWIAIPVLAGPDYIGRLGRDGMPSEPLTREVSLGIGEPIAARGTRLLVTEPEGAAMRFRVVECGDAPPPPPPAPSASSSE